MSANSSIEWTDATWNPIRARNLKTGKIGWHCEHATTGCEFCYAEGFNKRLGTGLPFKPGHRSDIELFLDEDMLTLPLRWKKPRRIFVCSMTDLFADFVPHEWIDKMFAVMALCPQHTFQALTKRAERMRSHLDKNRPFSVARACLDVFMPTGLKFPEDWPVASIGDIDYPDDLTLKRWPLPNVWLGTSCERQEEADARIPLLLQTPAAVRFISAEPLLGPIDLKHLAAPRIIGARSYDEYLDALLGERCSLDTGCMTKDDEPSLDWVIAGGESGSHARPMHPQWARDLRDQCQAAGVPFFFKQSGEFASVSEIEGSGTHFSFPDGTTVRRVGKKTAGRLLDGREWNEFPAVRP